MSEPRHLQIARSYIGVIEIPGPQHNPTIQKWNRRLKASWGDDETPWCGTFVAACLDEAGLPIIGQWASSRAWNQYGARLQADRLAPGAIMVFWRGSPQSWQGHVGFYVGEDPTHYHILGGNQSERDPATGRLKHTGGVNVMRIPKARFVGARWPRGLPVLGGPVHLSAAGVPVTSGNEV
jgi:uncharacterized protein (TIGR02594 family)